MAKEKNNTWMAKAMLKRDSNYSSVIGILSSDIKRFNEFSLFLEEQYNCPIYCYGGWRGLYDLRTNKPIKIGVKSNVFEGKFDKSATIKNIEYAFDYMDNLLCKQKTIFVIKNIDEILLQDKLEHINTAIRSWATESITYEKESSVFLFIANLSVISEEVKRLIALIRPELSTKEERKIMVSNNTKFHDPQRIDKIVMAGAGLSLHEFESAIAEAKMMIGYDKSQIEEFSDKFSNHILKFKEEQVKKTGMLEIMHSPKETFDDSIGGYKIIKDFIRNNVIAPVRNRKRCKKFCSEPPRGILFFGPPGTGKTLFAKAMATEVGIPFITFRLSNVLSKWVGESEQRLDTSLNLINEIAPCIVFIDELDRLGRRSMGGEDGGARVHREMFSRLMEWLGDKERKAIIIGTTNEPEYIDKAFLRTGRFDYKIPILWPDEDARIEIFKVHTKKLKERSSLSHYIKFSRLAKETHNYSGAEIEEIVKRASRIAAFRDKSKPDKINQNHFKKALYSLRIDPDQRESSFKRYTDITKEYCDDSEFVEELLNSHK